MNNMYNEIKIRFKEPVYRVDREKGTVSCKLLYYTVYPSFLYKMCNIDTSLKTIITIAKVGPEDTFDEKTGKRVALAKAERNAYKKVGKECFKHCKTFAKAYEKMYTFYAKANAVELHNSEYLKQF